MGFPLTDDGCFYIHQIPARTFLHSINGNSDPVRNLLLQRPQRFLPDHLSHDLPLRLVCNSVFIIELRPVRQIFKNTLDHGFQVLPSQCRSGYDLRKIHDLPVCVDKTQHFLFLYGVHLVDNQDHRQFTVFQLLCNVALPGSDKSGGLYQPENHIRVLEGALRHIYHIFTQLVFCLVDSRGIQKDDLALLTGVNSLDLISGCLRFPGCDGNLLSDQMVHQCGFTHVWPSDDRRKS